MSNNNQIDLVNNMSIEEYYNTKQQEPTDETLEDIQPVEGLKIAIKIEPTDDEPLEDNQPVEGLKMSIKMEPMDVVPAEGYPEPIFVVLFE